MEQWLESVYSDGTADFVSNPSPELFETVKIRIRVYEDAPVRHIFLRTVPNGAEHLIEAEREEVRNGLAYYAAPLQMVEKRMQYHFYIVCDKVIYYYTQKEITTYIPDHTYDFVLLTDYKQPSWVKHSVFYQIFPERFCNGEPANDVRSGEYSLDGHPTIQMENWEDDPLPYPKGFCLEFFGGDLQGVQKKIPYLKELGVTAVYLNPIFIAPTNHKYDCIDYFHVDPHFGGDEALAELSKALHENGMKLMLDISINHTGASHKWFNRDGAFFPLSQGAYNNADAKERGYYFFHGEHDYKSWLGVENLPTLNYTSDALREIIYRGSDSVLRKWLKPPYSIDGWRFDVADVFARNNDLQLAHEVWPEIRDSIREENDQAYILAEDWGDCAQYMQGDEWDSPMNYYGCGRPIRQLVGLPDLFLGRHELLRDVPYKMTAEDFRGRVMEHLAKLPFAFWENQFNLLDSHDVPRLHNHAQVHPEEYRGAVILQFMLIGAPSIYYGDEIGINGHIHGDDGCRYPMPWSTLKERQEQEVYRLYRTLAHLKRESRALADGGMKFLYAQDNVIALARFCGDECLIAVVSVDDVPHEIRLPIGSIGITRFDAKTDLFGTELVYEKSDSKSILLRVEAHRAYLLKNE